MPFTDLQKIILEKKGFDLNSKEEIEKFLNPNWERDLFDGAIIKDIEKGVDRIKKAIDKNEKIIIYGDYDADGIPGAVIMHDFFKKINYKNFSVYIPHRHNEGYGLNKDAIKKFIEDGVSLLITVDIGITNIEEIKFAEENNINVIVTDHHEPIISNLSEEEKDLKEKQIIPPAFAVINTKQSDCEYEEKYLCGASTAWKVVNVFLNKYRDEFNVPEGWEKWLLDMVGIATISDLVPLKNENRLFAKYGLLVLKKSKRPGLQKILANSKINQKKINEDDIAFSIAPRINSASRMADPVHAFYALLDNEEAVKYAEELEKYNTRRKEEIKIANSSIDYQKFKNKKIILIGDEKWSPGIIGLIASKVSEETGKITFVWGMGEDTKILKGSVRGIEDGESVVEIMTKAKNILENFGGHEAAGGFSLKKNNLIEFEKFLDNYILKIDNDKKNIKEVENYINIKTSEINKNIFDEIKIFSPFGVGNEKIIFKVNVNNLKIKRFGKELSHLEIFFDGVRGVEFFANEKIEEEIKIKKEFLVNLEWDNFRENVMLRLVK